MYEYFYLGNSFHKTPELTYDFISSMAKTNFGVTHYDGCGRDIFFLLHLTSTDDYKRT